MHLLKEHCTFKLNSARPEEAFCFELRLACKVTPYHIVEYFMVIVFPNLRSTTSCARGADKVIIMVGREIFSVRMIYC